MITDHAGQTPEVGDYVAYNKSGQIAAGYITSVGKSRNHPIYTIERIIPPKRDETWSKDNLISQVRGGPKCLLVLQKGTNND